MDLIPPINPEAFHCVELGLLDQLKEFPQKDLRPFLPILIRSSLLVAGDNTCRPKEYRQGILVPLSDIEPLNNFVALLSVDYNVLEIDVKKELQLRQKSGNREQDSVLVQHLQHGLALEYERADATRKLRLLLSETLFLMSQLHEPRQEYYMKVSELFDSWVYLEDICDTLCIALVELPNLLSPCDVCEAMLHVKYGPMIICRIVANMPDTFLEVCYHLIGNGDKVEEDSDGGLIRLRALEMLCKMNPSQRLVIRSRCVEQCRMPGLTIMLSLENELDGHQFVTFLSGILLGNDGQIRTWFSLYIRNITKKKSENADSLTKMREALWNYLREILKEAKEKALSEIAVVRASAFLRLVCALKGIAGLKFHEDEINCLLKLVTLNVPNTPAGDRYITLGICTLVACNSLVSSLDHEIIVVDWIRSLLKKDFSGVGTGNSTFEEILLLMAIHFHSNQLNTICDLVCSTLGMKIQIRVNLLSKIKQIFVNQVFVEKVVTTHAVKVPVTSDLSANLSGFLPVQCIYQLIKSRAFTKHQVPIKDWIYRQILTSKMPVHPVLPALLEVYVQSILVPVNAGNQMGKVSGELLHTNEPFTDEEILDVYSDFRNKDKLGTQLLILYYALLYEDARLANMRYYVSMGRKVKSYSPKLFYKIPIKFLLQRARANQEAAGGLFPPLLKLLTTHFPQLCLVNEWLEESTGFQERTPAEENFSEDISITPGQFSAAFASCSKTPVEIIRLLNLSKQLHPHSLWNHAKEIVNGIITVIQPSVPRKVQDLYKEVWYLLNNVYPRHLWEMTSNALLLEGSIISLTGDELTMDPLQILRCDSKVFRCAPILGILLHILAASLAASKYFLGKHLNENPSASALPGAAVDVEREELKVALTAVQESSAIQVLLEVCLATEEDHNKGISGELCLKEVQSLICSFIHQMFIADPNIAKLVHFQGYPLELLPVTVRGIPSMHICLDFSLELLAQPAMEKQVFAIQLISYLSMQYSIPKSYNIAKHALTTISAMPCINSEERAGFYIPAVSALERLCEAFPPLVDDSITILLNLGKICTSQNSVERNRMSKIVRNKYLLQKIQETYERIVQHALLDKKVF